MWGRRLGALGVAVIALAGACTDETDAPQADLRDETAEIDDLAAATAEPASAGRSRLRIAVGSELGGPWRPAERGCDAACRMVWAAVTDTLFATSADGEVVGLLVEDVQQNDDATLHTWRLRDGIRFHDGTDFDAEAVAANIDACVDSPLTGPGLAGIDGVRADGLELTITTLAPWATLAAHFAETPCGHVFAPRWLADGDEAPVGLGAYLARLDGDSLLLDAADDYWRPDTSSGAGDLPHHGQFEIVPIAAPETRWRALGLDQVDAVVALSPPDDGTATPSAGFVGGDVAELVVNAEAGSALSDRLCRIGVRARLDRRALAAAVGGDVLPALGFDAPGSVGSAAVGAFGVAGTDGVTADGVAPCGTDPVTLLGVVGDPLLDAVAEQVARAAGIEVAVERLSAAELGVRALLGDFEALVWSNHAGLHPDLRFPWWYGEAARPVGDVSTNVARQREPTVDAALVAVRRASDAESMAAAQAALAAAVDDAAWHVPLVRRPVLWAPAEHVVVDAARVTPEGRALVERPMGVPWLARVTRTDG